MLKYNLNTFPGVDTGEGDMNRINKLLASPHSTIEAPEFALGMVVIEPNHGHEIHQHPANREICVVIEGELVLYQEEGGEGIQLKEGDFFQFDYNEPHGFWNKGDKTARMLWTYYPAGNAEDRFLNKTKA